MTTHRPRGWYLRHSLWVILIFLGFGVISFIGWLVGLATLRDSWMVRRVLLWTIVSILPIIACVMLVYSWDSDPADSPASSIVLVGVAASIVIANVIIGTLHALLMMPQVWEKRIAWEDARDVQRAQPFELDIYRPVVREEPVSAQPIRTVPAPPATRKTRPQLYANVAELIANTVNAKETVAGVSSAGGTFDINRISSEQLQHLTPLSAEITDRIVTTREEIGGFDSIFHLMQTTGLHTHELVGIHGRVVFNPYQRKLRTHQPGGTET